MDPDHSVFDQYLATLKHEGTAISLAHPILPVRQLYQRGPGRSEAGSARTELARWTQQPAS